MSTILIVQQNGTLSLDPSDVRFVVADYDASNLKADITIAASTWTITVMRQNGATALTKDNPAILTALEATTALERTVGASRATRVRLIATTATAGDLYEVANTITTSESPAQTKEKSFYVLIGQQ